MKSTLIKGTLILSFAGIISRILGFFYKIFLSDILGAEQLGIYQLIFPIYSLCFTIYASGIQTSISRLIATQIQAPKKTKFNILLKGIFLSFFLACSCSFFLYFFSDFIATKIIQEPRCASSLRLLCFVFPFCSISACITGFYYGLKKTSIPAMAQLIEQISRIAFSLLFIYCFTQKSHSISCAFAIVAIAIGEATAMFYNLLTLSFQTKSSKQTDCTLKHSRKIYSQILIFAIPLTATHLVISILHSVEAFLIPNMLKTSGLSTKTALSIYGILTGMSMSLLLFPSTIPNSLSVLLLPSISEAQSQKRSSYIKTLTERTISYSLLIGYFFSGLFLLFGKEFGELFFHNQLAGTYLQPLSFLCPLLYLSTTLNSILNGMGFTKITFLNTTIGLSIRILLLYLFIPQNGISGYFIALLISQVILSSLELFSTKKYLNYHIPCTSYVLLPILFSCVEGFFSYELFQLLKNTLVLPTIIPLCLACCIYLLLYAISLKLLDLI